MQPREIETIWRYIPLIDGPFNDIWVSFFSTAIVVGLQLYVRVGASYHVCCILSTIISSIYRLCITHKQLQSLLTFLYMHSLDWCLLQEVWIRLIMAKGQRHDAQKY